jgi:Ca-activated chloride channel family protein
MFELAFPWAFIILPLPLLLWFLLPKASLQLSVALRVPFFQAMSHLVDKEQKNLSTRSAISVFLLIWALLLLALSGPRWVGNPQPIAREGYNILLALDISGSMEFTDMMLHGRPATRLDIVKKAAMQFVQERTGDKIGLILFGSNAYLQTPLTYDSANVLMRIDDATVGLAGKTTSIGDALGLAVKRFQSAPAKGRVIILLTDGANNSGVLTPERAAELAKADGIKVYTIGLGMDISPNTLSSVFYNGAPSDLDENTLKQVAEITGGQYFRASDLQSLESIYRMINELEVSPQEQETIRPQRDFYPWPLALALALFLGWSIQYSRVAAVFNDKFRGRREEVRYEP